MAEHGTHQTICITGTVEHILPLSRSLPTVLGVGGWFKNTLCLIQGNQAFITPTVGDLDNAEACSNHQSHTQHFLENLPQSSLQAIAHDLHPDFFSSRQALHYAANYRVLTHAVQHHHAHIAAVCAEYGEEGSVLGLALDGVGLGTDGSAWGGELLQVQGADFERLGHLTPLQMPGGDKAAREPWRMAAALLFAAGRGEEIVQRFADQAGAAMVLSQLQRNLNCPKTSSMGRVFDAVAGLLGICPVMTYEAEAAILLEKAATVWVTEHGWPVCLSSSYLISEDESGLVLNLQPLLSALADWPADKTGEEAAAVFHASLVAALVNWVSLVAQKQGVNKVALAGGCFFNGLLSSHLPAALQSLGLHALMLKTLLPGDSSIALGQAWVAALLVEKSIEEKIECV